jgi:SAM-dependent methyltransferase
MSLWATFRSPVDERPWDDDFRQWIESAKREGVDPNDVGDREWGDPGFDIETYYYPYIHKNSVVLELGPGSGRITRRVIGRCREILVDYSHFVCRWLEKYLAGKGKFSTVLIDKPYLRGVAEAKVNFLFAFGVVEHIGVDDLRWFLEEFWRVLAPGGVAVFNFNNLMTEKGLAWHKRWRCEPGHRNLFRFYHPETVAWLARDAGFTVLALHTDQSRLGAIELRKGAPGG